MSYANLTDVACTDKAEAFCRMRDFICKRNGTYDYSTTGIGWTLFDSSYAVDEDNPALNDWCVFHSTGEDGDKNIYFYFKWTSGAIWLANYLAWNPTTQAGTESYKCGSYSLPMMSETMTTGEPIWVYGDLNMLVILTAYTTDLYRGGLGGWVPSLYDSITAETVTVSTAQSAGTAVTLTPDSIPTHWVVGLDLYVYTSHTNDISTSIIEKARITAIDSTTVTLTLVNDYTADFKLTDHYGMICSSSTIFGACEATILPDGTTGDKSITSSYNSDLPTANFDPDSFSDFFGLYTLTFYNAVGGIGYLVNSAKTPVFNDSFVHTDLVTQLDGTSWRLFKVYSAVYMAFKEV